MNVRQIIRILHLSILILLGSSVLGSAQVLDHHLGEILVQLHPKTNPQTLAKQLQYFEGQRTRVELEAPISAKFGIWKLRFDLDVVQSFAI